jgi:hypothetical protein
VSTTNLFVELLVIGVGAAGWLILFTLAALGYDAAFVKGLLSTPAAIVPGVVAVYLLGIITDRIADSALQFLRTERKRLLYFPSADEAFKVRDYVLTKSPYFASQFEYNRSRQRICRGWIFNFIFLAIGLNTLLYVRPEAFARAANLGSSNPWYVSFFVTPMLLLLALACWFAWEKLSDAELRRMRAQAKSLREIDADPRQRD